MGKKDESAVVSYQMQSDNGIEILDNLDQLRGKLAVLEHGQEIFVTLTPEYFGLVSWKFFKLKSRYISFVTIRKKADTRCMNSWDEGSCYTIPLDTEGSPS